MYSKIYTYALIRCLYNRNEDYIDTFWSFIVNVLPKDKTGLTLEQIQNEIDSKFKIFIPIHSLSVIATRATRKGYLTREYKKCIITDKGIDLISSLESEREELRRINELIEDARQYLSREHNINLTFNEIESIIETIIKQNLLLFEQFIDTTNNLQKPKKNFTNKYDNALIDYFFFVEKTRPNIFRTLQDIIFGSIISTIVNQNSFEEFDKKIAQITVFTDSNYLFSLLGLHYSEQNKPARELFDLMKSQSNIQLKVFDFTIEEMINVLKKYNTEQQFYPKGIKIDSIYSSMKTNGYTAADIKELIIGLEKKLWDFGIKILPTKVDLNKYDPEVLERRTLLTNYKGDQGTREQNHDLAAIDIISKSRGGDKKKIENCDMLFLTSDIRLAKFNYLEDGHKNKATISEVIPDKLLTNILWLKNPTTKTEFHLSSWIALHSRYFFIDRSTWKLFYNNLKELRNEGKINDLDISILLFDNHIQEVLKDSDPSDIKNMEGTLLLESILKAKERYEQKHSNEINDLKLFFDEEIKRSKEEADFYNKQTETELSEKLSKSNYEKITLEDRLKYLEKDKIERDSRILEQISKWKKKQELSVEKSIDKMMKIISAIYIIVIFSLLYFISDVIQKNWNIVEPFVLLSNIFLTSVAFYFGITKDSFSVKTKIREKLFNKYLSKKLQQIEEIETLINL